MRSVFITIAFSFLFALSVYGGAVLNLYTLPSFTIVITLYMTFMTGSVLWIIQKQNNRILFSQAYLASIVYKILTGLAMILVLIQLDPKAASGNAALFIIAYIAFTAIEVACLLYDIRSQEK